VDALYHKADSGSPGAILVSHRLDTDEGRRSLKHLILGWPGLVLKALNEKHIVAVLKPGGALRSGR